MGTKCRLLSDNSLFFFSPEKGPRGEKGSPGEAVIETIKTEVSSLASQSKWACFLTPLLGEVPEASRPVHS